jgi:hypothetical protein
MAMHATGSQLAPHMHVMSHFSAFLITFHLSLSHASSLPPLFLAERQADGNARSGKRLTQNGGGEGRDELV